ncbi:pectinesterase family protein [Faecalibacterium sp. CLA-AA-H254]|uniref:pectinesterase family protein n=1 Tax=Faecalibacterium hominis (ex Afrizal et al. 2022) TaxID=2881265 RepID=UPI001D0F26EA|nr:pectinesterase family protein [Faecalibacterium hominis (ex Afrizal et al. 2022)]MCC2122163.1 pectinesterase family protein [Faecalibacterium hominis (ex Afrizal et al. 2022)]
MLKLTVSQDGSGDFSSISEAVLAVPYELEAEICIGPGIYREKLVCEKRALTLRGAGADATTLIFGDGGKLPHPDGRPTHTFRSYTAFFSGGSVTVEDLTIANDAGPGSAVGQAIAAYVDAEKAVFRRVRLLGNQDTLFCAPLPEAEREKDGFLGPRKFAPRRPSAQYYQSCEIAGDIDFIFGGADALFEQCILRTVDNHLPHSYITAPSGSANGLGFVFWDCDFVSDCPAGTVYLGRPWRPTGKTAVLDCRLGAHIAPEGFSGWNDRTDTCLARFAETGSSGPGACQRPDWVAAPSAADAAAVLARARKLCRP